MEPAAVAPPSNLWKILDDAVHGGCIINHDSETTGKPLRLFVHLCTHTDGGYRPYPVFPPSPLSAERTLVGPGVEKGLQRVHHIVIRRLTRDSRHCATTSPSHVHLSEREQGIKILSNGAWKLFTFHLFSLLSLDVGIRIATTSDPRHDWCGTNLPHISGVVDVLLVHGEKRYLVGEVKSDNCSGFNQAKMRNGHMVNYL